MQKKNNGKCGGMNRIECADWGGSREAACDMGRFQPFWYLLPTRTIVSIISRMFKKFFYSVTFLLVLFVEHEKVDAFSSVVSFVYASPGISRKQIFSFFTTKWNCTIVHQILRTIYLITRLRQIKPFMKREICEKWNLSSVWRCMHLIWLENLEIYGGEAGKFGWINKLLISWYMIEAILFRDFYLIPIGLSHSATLTHCWFGMDFL